MAEPLLPGPTFPWGQVPAEVAEGARLPESRGIRLRLHTCRTSVDLWSAELGERIRFGRPNLECALPWGQLRFVPEPGDAAYVLVRPGAYGQEITLVEIDGRGAPAVLALLEVVRG